MNPFDVLLANHLCHERFSDASLIGCITNQRRWSAEAYWEIELALYDLAQQVPSNERLFRDAVREAVFIFSHIMLSFGWHFDPNDEFEYENLSRDKLYQWRERAHAIFEGFLSGSMPDNTALQLRNPLLK